MTEIMTSGFWGPGVASNGQERPRTARRAQKAPADARSRQEWPGTAWSGLERPGAASRRQEGPGAASSGQARAPCRDPGRATVKHEERTRHRYGFSRDSTADNHRKTWKTLIIHRVWKLYKINRQFGVGETRVNFANVNNT